LYRKHLQSFDYKYRIDVQPQIAVPVDALMQGMRFILFNLNKKYLKVRKFGHLPADQKFWAIAFKEGDGVSKGQHYHILLHCPVERIDPLADIIMQWSKLRLRQDREAIRPMPAWVKAQSYGHVPCDDLDNVPLLRVERCQSQLGSIIYNTKQWRPISNDNPIIGLCET
jgi:hypothetical protein